MRLTGTKAAPASRLVTALEVASSCSLFLFPLQKYKHHDEDGSPQEQSSPPLTDDTPGPELVQVAEKNISQIENVHGYVAHAHISPMK
ncbi:discs large homolog 1-like protein isoform X11, partial [Tachysurus ichikawai]